NQLHGEGPRTEVEYRLAWSRTYLKRFGILDNSSRGVWSLTPLGLENEEVDPEEVTTHYQDYYLSKQRNRGKKNRPNEKQGDLTLPIVIPKEDDKWREDFLDLLLNLSPDTFERLCQRLLRESGFIEVEVTGRSGDGGIDGHGIIRLVGLVSFPVLFQCKRYKGTVSPNQVRDFRGAMTGRADKGLIITTGGFTREARREATREGAPPIDLIDGDHLIDILMKLELGVSVRKVEVLEINNEWFEKI
ncbi:MAG: restriction endonuclease, partial [Gemmatimonadetes bacterium]|nr:restriction endonuclease [Gemmatimonadota bacterium]